MDEQSYDLEGHNALQQGIYGLIPLETGGDFINLLRTWKREHRNEIKDINPQIESKIKGLRDPNWNNLALRLRLQLFGKEGHGGAHGNPCYLPAVEE